MTETPRNSDAVQEQDGYFAIHPLMIRNWSKGRFALHLRQGGRYVLYTNKGDAFNQEHRDKLDSLGVAQVFVDAADREAYAAYVLENLSELLLDDGIPMEHRGQAWFQASLSLTRRVFEEKLPRGVAKRRFAEISELLRTSVDFFAQSGSLKHVARLLGRGYQLYNHSLGTAVMAVCVTREYPDVDKDLLHAVGVGALLHDIGKSVVPRELLEHDPETLSFADRDKVRSHASAGVGLCADLPLARESVNCILFHHERMDGSGYPSGLTGEALPFYVRVLAACDVYDNMTRAAPWRPARSPYEALRFMKTHKEAYDLEVLKRLITVLSGAEVSTR